MFPSPNTTQIPVISSGPDSDQIMDPKGWIWIISWKNRKYFFTKKNHKCIMKKFQYCFIVFFSSKKNYVFLSQSNPEQEFKTVREYVWTWRGWEEKNLEFVNRREILGTLDLNPGPRNTRDPTQPGNRADILLKYFKQFSQKKESG